MLYVTCPTCGIFLSNKNKEFEDKKNNISLFDIKKIFKNLM